MCNRAAIILRSHAIRMTAQAIQRPNANARMLTTRITPDPTHPTTDQSEIPHHKKPQNSNTLYIGGGLGLAAIGAIWYYYATEKDAPTDKERDGLGLNKATVSASQWGNEQTIEDANRSVKERGQQEALKSGDAKYRDIKTEAQAKVQASKDQFSQSTDRGKQRLEEGKDQAARLADEVKNSAERKVDAAKSSGSAWLSWGKSQTQAAADDLKRRVDETQEAWSSRFEEAKRKAAEKGEDIKQRANETEEEFRNRIAKAIQRR